MLKQEQDRNNSEQNNQRALLINSTLDILDYRYITTNSKRYHKILEKEAFQICSMYNNNSEELFFNGFVNEAAFLLAYQNCFNSNGNKIEISDAQEDLSGFDFKIKVENNSPIPLDVTISKKAYAHRLTQPRKNIILLPIVDPKNETYFIKLLLENPTLENFQHYLDFTARYNERILNNQSNYRFEIDILKGKRQKPQIKEIWRNGDWVYCIQMAQNQHSRLCKIVNHLKDFTT